MRTLLVFTVLVLFSSFADARPRIAIIDNDQGTLDLSTGEICIGARNTCFEGLSLDSGITPFLRDRVRLHACYFNEGSREAPETRGCVSNVIRVFRNIDYDLGLDESVFTERSLRNPPRQWLRRSER